MQPLFGLQIPCNEAAVAILICNDTIVHVILADVTLQNVVELCISSLFEILYSEEEVDVLCIIGVDFLYFVCM